MQRYGLLLFEWHVHAADFFSLSYVIQTFVQFLIRLAGIVGGIVVCSGRDLCYKRDRDEVQLTRAKTGYAWRVGHAAARVLKRTMEEQELNTGTMPMTSPSMGRGAYL